MLEIWGRRNSSNVQTVMWTVGELGLDYTRRDVGGTFGGTDTPEYRAMNPNGVVPTLVDDGRVLWESNVIARYLAATYGKGSLWLDDGYQRALADQWMEWSKTTFYPALMPIFFNLIRTPPAQQDKNAVERGVKTSAKLIQYLDQHLQRHAFVAGDQFSVGDIPLGAPLYRYFNMAIERPELPGVNAWYQRMCERPAFQKHVMIPFGESLDDWNRLEQEGAGVQ